MHDYLLSIDFGSIKDPTALILSARSENPAAVNEGEPRHIYEILHIETLPLNMSYVDIISYIEQFILQESIRGCVQLVVDCTGVGKAVLDLMRSSVHLTDITWGIVFTAGQGVTQKGMLFKVPKKDLIASVLILTGKDLIHCDPKIDQAKDLRSQLLGYVTKKTSAAGMKFENESSKLHDDLVVALCMLCWLGERIWIDSSFSGGIAGAIMPEKSTSGSPMITRETGGPNLGFGRPPRTPPVEGG